MISLGKCAVCQKPVDRNHDHAFKVSGWERSRAKGLNALYDKRREPVIAHWTCLKHPPGQESFAA